MICVVGEDVVVVVVGYVNWVVAGVGYGAIRMGDKGAVEAVTWLVGVAGYEEVGVLGVVGVVGVFGVFTGDGVAIVSFALLSGDREVGRNPNCSNSRSIHPCASAILRALA